MEKKKNRKKVALIALGCSKNLVDSENMTGLLMQAGYEMTADSAEANVIVVNTCGFIASAVEEAIDAILNAADYKKEGACDFLIVTGCMAQRYYKDIARDLPEADAILGVGSYADIVKTIEELYQTRAEQGKRGPVIAQQESSQEEPAPDLKSDPESGSEAAAAAGPDTGKKAAPLLHRSTNPADRLLHLQAERPISTGVYAYLKVAEGCNKRCHYCAIPGIRGDLCSRPYQDLLVEAEKTVAQGVKELILVAQDTTSYGMDLTGERQLAKLLQDLAEKTAVEDLRFLYAYADGMTDELIETIKANDKIIPYIDLPIQHAADSVLKRMGRSDTAQFLRATFAKLRRELPDVTLRTTVMVGYPGETEAEFEALCQFIKDIRFDRLGCFIFSPEQGTPAYRLPDRVAPALAQERYNKVMAIQQEIAATKNKNLLGSCHTVLVEGVADDGIFYTGRLRSQAPDVDDVTYILSEQPLTIGERYLIKIVQAEDYELTGVVQ